MSSMQLASERILEHKAQVQVRQIKGFKNLIFQMEQQEAQFPVISPQQAHQRSITKGRLEERARAISAALVLSYKSSSGALKKVYRDLIRAHLEGEEWWQTLFRYASKIAKESYELLKRAAKVANQLDEGDREHLLKIAKLGLGVSLAVATWPFLGVGVEIAGAIASVLTFIFGWQVTAFAGTVIALIAAGNPAVQGAYTWTREGLESASEIVPRLKELWAETA